LPDPFSFKKCSFQIKWLPAPFISKQIFCPFKKSLRSHPEIDGLIWKIVDFFLLVLDLDLFTKFEFIINSGEMEADFVFTHLS
jgi:hypothetical protein